MRVNKPQWRLSCPWWMLGSLAGSIAQAIMGEEGGMFSPASTLPGRTLAPVVAIERMEATKGA